LNPILTRLGGGCLWCSGSGLTGGVPTRTIASSTEGHARLPILPVPAKHPPEHAAKETAESVPPSHRMVVADHGRNALHQPDALPVGLRLGDQSFLHICSQRILIGFDYRVNDGLHLDVFLRCDLDNRLATAHRLDQVGTAYANCLCSGYVRT